METRDRDHLDEWLDKALQQYGNAEPRIGIESRILANMEAAGKRPLFGYSYGWLLAAASTATVLVGIWFEVWHRPLTATKKEPAPQFAGDVATQMGPKITPAVRPRHIGTKMPLLRHPNAAADVESARGPRLEQFPSPRPPSEQEVLLTRYAERFPAEARLVAQQQDKFQQEIQQAEQEMKNASPDSEQ
jgi:hypothetical protein